MSDECQSTGFAGGHQLRTETRRRVLRSVFAGNRGPVVLLSLTDMIVSAQGVIRRRTPVVRHVLCRCQEHLGRGADFPAARGNEHQPGDRFAMEIAPGTRVNGENSISNDGTCGGLVAVRAGACDGDVRGSDRTARKWLARHRADGVVGLLDRS